MRITLCGAALGLVWGAGLRGWMAVLAGEQSRYTWSGTVLGVLLPATLVGATLGWAEQARRKGGRRAWRWAALSPLLFIVMPALVQADFVAQLQTGLGTGAIGTALVGMVGGHALSGRGPRWARAASRTTSAAVILATIVGTSVSGAEPRLHPPSPTNAFLALTLLALLSLLAAACAIPHLPAQRELVAKAQPGMPGVRDGGKKADT
jgi:hypothetical protein